MVPLKNQHSYTQTFGDLQKSDLIWCAINPVHPPLPPAWTHHISDYWLSYKERKERRKDIHKENEMYVVSMLLTAVATSIHSFSNDIICHEHSWHTRNRALTGTLDKISQKHALFLICVPVTIHPKLWQMCKNKFKNLICNLNGSDLTTLWTITLYPNWGGSIKKVLAR